MIKIKKVSIFVAILLICSFILAIFSINNKQVIDIDTVEIASVTNNVTKNWVDLKNAPESIYNYKVIDLEGKVLYGAATDDSYKQQLQDANAMRNVVSDIIINDNLVGKIIFDTPSIFYLKNIKVSLNTIIIVLLLTLIAIVIFYFVYLHQRVYKPFSKMTKFAHTIASGELDIPLIMDRNNIFGAYTESFDIMREKLKEARQNEYLANVAKKEVVASISHDLHAPLAVIKATCECMELNNKSKHLEVLMSKVNDMETLINDMLISTLDELCELKIICSAIKSSELYKFINYADYNGKIQEYEVPECTIICDEVRLNQTICNIIGNAYKYGGEKIDIRFKLEKEVLIIKIRDNGENLNKNEIALLTNKYYRGSNVEKQSGAGLGLFITKTICEQMGGGFSVYIENGFVAEIAVKVVQ